MNEFVRNRRAVDASQSQAQAKKTQGGRTERGRGLDSEVPPLSTASHAAILSKSKSKIPSQQVQSYSSKRPSSPFGTNASLSDSDGSDHHNERFIGEDDDALDPHHVISIRSPEAIPGSDARSKSTKPLFSNMMELSREEVSKRPAYDFSEISQRMTSTPLHTDDHGGFVPRDVAKKPSIGNIASYPATTMSNLSAEEKLPPTHGMEHRELHPTSAHPWSHPPHFQDRDTSLDHAKPPGVGKPTDGNLTSWQHAKPLSIARPMHDSFGLSHTREEAVLDVMQPISGSMLSEDIFDQPFDTKKVIDESSNKEGESPDDQRVAALLRLSDQQKYEQFQEMDIAEWTRVGQLIQKRMDEVSRKLSETRQSHRDVAQRFEQEIYRRYEDVKEQGRQIDQLLQEMGSKGRAMLLPTLEMSGRSTPANTQ